MNIYTTLIAMLFMAISAQAQDSIDPIYSFPFNDSLDGWTTVGISSLVQDSAANAVWVHTPNGTAETGAYAGELAIASLSGGGAVLFDSDGLDNAGIQGNFANGPAPAPQRSELCSPSLDFSEEDRVLLTFYQYYRYFAKDSGEPDFTTPNSSVLISNGTTDTIIVLNEDVGPNEATSTRDIKVYDISSIAAGQSDVTVKFIWEGEYYFWVIDDVRFFSEKGKDLAILEFTNINNFETPDLGLENDTTDFEMMIANFGDSDILDSIEFVVRVLDENLEVVFSDTGYIDTLLVGDTIIWDFDRHWIPELLPQNDANSNYNVVYNVRCKGDTLPEVVKPDDNVDFQGFVVRDLTYRKVPGGDGFGFTGQTQTGFDDFAFMNYFKFDNSITETFTISNVFFDAFSVADDDPLVGKNVIIYVIKLPEEVVEQNGFILAGEVDLVNFDFDMDLDEMVIAGYVIGIGSYQFSLEDDENGGPFNAQVFDFEAGEGPVVIDPGSSPNRSAHGTTKYFVAVRYQDAANSIAQEISRSFKLWQISTLAYYPSFGTAGGWRLLSTQNTSYAENIAAIGFDLELLTAVDENPLPENSVKIYPNPASEFIKVDITFEKSTNTTVVIADMSGKIIEMDLHENLQAENLTYNMERYPAGTYVVRVSTREGTKTEHVIVAK